MRTTAEQFGILDLRSGDPALRQNTLRVAENVIPVDSNGSERVYAPMPPPDTIPNYPSGITASCQYHRTQRGKGKANDGTTEELYGNKAVGYDADHDRLILTKEDGFYVAQKPYAGDEAYKIYNLNPDAKGRKTVFMPFRRSVFAATSVVKGGLQGVERAEGLPESLVEIIDDTAVGLTPPPLPLVNHEFEAGVNTELSFGAYFYRVAWVFADGSLSAPSRPSLLEVPLVGNCKAIKFFVDYPDRTLEYPEYRGIISGIAILMTQRAILNDANADGVIDAADYPTTKDGFIALYQQLNNSPYYHVATIQGFKVGNSVLWNDRNEAIPLCDFYKDDLITGATITAATGTVYNGRLVLGDTIVSFQEPSVEQNLDLRKETSAPLVFEDVLRGTGSPSNSFQYDAQYDPEIGDSTFIRLAVELDAGSLTIKRFSKSYKLSDDAAESLYFRDFMFAYPDIRASRMFVYVWSGSVWKCTRAFSLDKSAGNNVAYCVIDAGLDVTSGSTSYPDMSDNEIIQANAVVDHEPTRWVTSDLDQPRSLRASRVQYTGLTSGDGIIGFIANTRSVGVAQFGEYPMIILNQGSISVAEVGGGDIAFSSTRFIATTIGCAGRYAFTGTGGIVFVADKSGIWTLVPNISDAPISYLITDPENKYSITRRIDADTVLTYMLEHNMGRREVWVSCGHNTDIMCNDDNIGHLTYIFSLDHKCWTWASRKRNNFVIIDGKLHGISIAGTLEDESVYESSTPIRMLTTPNGLGETGIVKRLRRIAIRQQINRSDELNYAVLDISLNGEVRSVSCGKIHKIPDDGVDEYPNTSPQLADAGFGDVFSVNSTVQIPFVAVYGAASPNTRILGIEFGYDLKDLRRKRIHPINITKLFNQQCEDMAFCLF